MPSTVDSSPSTGSVSKATIASVLLLVAATLALANYVGINNVVVKARDLASHFDARSLQGDVNGTASPSIPEYEYEFQNGTNSTNTTVPSTAPTWWNATYSPSTNGTEYEYENNGTLTFSPSVANATATPGTATLSPTVVTGALRQHKKKPHN